eukprot:m.51745 g.51745  ORF g.51745 m.51745 type:complete len:255 (-) comp10750_c2_seq1:90-854(-)
MVYLNFLIVSVCAVVALFIAVYRTDNSRLISTSTKETKYLNIMDAAQHAKVVIVSKPLQDDDAILYEAFHNSDKTPVKYAEFLDLLENDKDLALQMSNTLAASPFPAFFWETPGVTLEDSASVPFQFVLVNSGRLDGVRPDPEAFSKQFEACKVKQGENALVCSFPNLGHDAELVSPVPQMDSLENYAHIAAFVRGASKEQNIAMFHLAAKSMKKWLISRSPKPGWMSTSGLGIYWLHVRLDSRPKYYTYKPFA